jgi:SAM-dependent methyltransferase
MSIESSDSFPKKAAAALGSGRMSEAEKREYLESHQDKLHHNADFVSVETYIDLFKKIDLTNKIVVNIGAGYSVSPLHYGAMNPVTMAISKIGVPMTFIPVDYNHDRTKSWLLLDTHDPKKNDLIQLEPVTGDATHLPFGDSSLDVYISTNLINEPREDELESNFVRRMIGEAYRVLRPGGSIVLSSFGYVWHRNADGGGCLQQQY